MQFPPIIDFTDRSGFQVVFNQFPNGVELMKVVDNTKPMARMYDDAPIGVFALSLKVDNLEKAIAEINRLDKINPSSPDYSIILNYLDKIC